MKKVFDQNSPFWKAMGRIFDAFALNTLWLICCIPIITIGPSTTAFYYSMLGMIRGDGGYITRDFFKSFRRNLKQGILLGLPLNLLGCFLALDIYLCYKAGGGIYTFFLFFLLVLFLLWFAMSIYTYMILAKFDKSNREILLWAFTSALKNLPKTLLMMLVVVMGIWLIHIAPGLIIIIPGLIVENHCVILAKIFAAYLPTPYEMESGVNLEEFKIEDINDMNQWLL